MIATFRRTTRPWARRCALALSGWALAGCAPTVGELCDGGGDYALSADPREGVRVAYSRRFDPEVRLRLRQGFERWGLVIVAERVVGPSDVKGADEVLVTECASVTKLVKADALTAEAANAVMIDGGAIALEPGGDADDKVARVAHEVGHILLGAAHSDHPSSLMAEPIGSDYPTEGELAAAWVRP